MTAGDILTLAYELLNESSSSPFISTNLSFSLLNNCLYDIYTSTGIVTKQADVSVSSGTSSYDLPSDFFSIPTRPCNITILKTDTTPYTSINYLPYQEFVLYSVNPSSTTSVPSYFTISYDISSSTLVKKLLLYPVPSENMTLTITYIPTPPAISSSTDDIPLPHDLKFPIACYVAWTYKYRDKEPNFGDYFYRTYINSLKKYTSVLIESFRPSIKWTRLG